MRSAVVLVLALLFATTLKACRSVEESSGCAESHSRRVCARADEILFCASCGYDAHS